MNDKPPLTLNENGEWEQHTVIRSPRDGQETEIRDTVSLSHQRDRAEVESKTADSNHRYSNSSNPMVGRQGQYKLSLVFAALLGLIYAATTYTSGFQHLSPIIADLGTLYPPFVLQGGEWWRLITANLLHANLGHLFNNAFGILVFGSLLEPQIGSLRLFGLYVASAVIGLGFSMIMLPTTPTLGASAIDFGLMAAYFTLVLVDRYLTERAAFAGQLRSAIFFVAIFVGWNSLELHTVNLWAHIGGFVAGILYMLLLLLIQKTKKSSS